MTAHGNDCKIRSLSEIARPDGSIFSRRYDIAALLGQRSCACLVKMAAA